MPRSFTKTYREEDDQDGFTARLKRARGESQSDANQSYSGTSFTDRLHGRREQTSTDKGSVSPTIQKSWAHQQKKNGLAGSMYAAALGAASERSKRTEPVKPINQDLPFGTYSATFKRDEGRDLIQRAAMNAAWESAVKGPQTDEPFDIRKLPVSELSVPSDLKDPFGENAKDERRVTNPLLADPGLDRNAGQNAPSVASYEMPSLSGPSIRYDEIARPEAPVQTERRRDPEAVANEMAAAALNGPDFSYANLHTQARPNTGDDYTDTVLKRLARDNRQVSDDSGETTFSDRLYSAMGGDYALGGTTPQNDPFSYVGYASDAEKSIINYLGNTGQNDKLREYLDALKPVWEKRQTTGTTETVGEFAEKMPGVASAISVLQAPTRGLSYLGQVLDYADDGKIDEYASYNNYSRTPEAIRSAISKKIEDKAKGFWGKAGSFAYQTGMSMADFLVTALASGAFNGGYGAVQLGSKAVDVSEALSLSIMGTGAAASSTIEAKERGLSDKQAFALGTIAGLAEVVTEKVSLEALLKPDYSQGALKYIIKNALSEGSEEVASDLINFVADTLIAADKSKLRERVRQLVAEENISEKEAFGRALAEQAGDTALSFLGGAVSGGIMGGVGAAINWTNFQRAKQEFAAANGMTSTQVDTLVDILNDTDTERQSARLNALVKDVAGEGRSNLDQAARLYAEERQTRTAEGRIALVEQELAQDPAAQNIGEAGRRIISENWNGNQRLSGYVGDMITAYNAGRGGELNVDILYDGDLIRNNTDRSRVEQAFEAGKTDMKADREIRTAEAQTLAEEAAPVTMEQEIFQKGEENGEGQSIGTGEERINGLDSDRQTGAMAESAGRFTGRTAEELGRPASRFKERRQVNAARVFEGGDPNTTFTEVEYDERVASDDEKSSRLLLRQAGYADANIHFFSGEVRNIDGMVAQAWTNGNSVWVPVDNKRFTVKQMAMHEALHALVSKGSINVKSIASWMQTNRSYAWDNLLEQYKRAYEGSGMSESEIVEEIIADGMGGVNIYAGELGKKQNKMATFMPAVQKAIEQVTGKTIDEIVGTGNTPVSNIGKDTRFSRTLKSEELRQSGAKLTEKQFYSLYSAHKLDLRRNGNIEEQIRSIKENGFKGHGGFTGNTMPTDLSYKTENGKKVPANVSVGQYAPRRGDTILLVPRSGLNSQYNVKYGYRPDFDYEIVRADYDYQPYYEMYSKAYDAINTDNSGSDVNFTGDNTFYGVDGNGVKFSLKSLQTDISEGRMRQDLIDSGFGEDETDALFKGLEKLAKYIAEPGRVEILDLNETEGREDRVYKPYKPNSDPLYVISLDYSTMCRKRLMTQFVIEHLQLEMHRVMSAEEQLAIRDKLNEYREQEKALQVACAMCYVEAARLKSPKQIQKYFDDPGAIVSKYLAMKDKSYDSYIEKIKGDVKETLGYDRDATKKQMSGRDATTLNGITQKLRSGKDYSSLTAREKAAISEEQYRPYEPSEESQKIIEEAKNLSVDNYLSAANLTRLATEHPEIYGAYSSHVRASTHSKGIESDVAYYYGDADSISDSFIDSVNRENGMRSNSWSDFQFTHLLDQIVATIELHNRGASMHAYTKFLEQVRIFGNTGEMFNLSGVPAQVGVDADGNLQFSDTESVHVNMSEEHLETVRKIRDAFSKLRAENPGKRFTIDDALKEAGIDQLDDYDALIAREEFTQTAGLQSIAMNERHLRALLRSDLVDYVIPYHKSGMNASLRKMANIYHWTDFEKQQSEKGSGKTPVFSEWMLPESEWGKKTGIEIMRESADRYLALCKERGLTPKFEDYTDEKNYWKLLIDRKMIDQQTGKIIKQQIVSPDFDFERIETEIDKYVSNYDPNLENKALDYIRKNWDAVQASIPELKKGGAVRQAIRKADNAERKMRNAAMRVNDLSNQVLVAEVKYSSEADSEGRSLSRQQAEYFKDSKIRDEDGNLQVVYHGTDADFTVFDRTKGRSTMDIQGSFFSPWDIDAAGYGSNVQAYYLNIKNPAPESVAYAALNRFKGQNNAGIKAREYLESRGYDGVNNGNEEYIAFYPEQIKKLDNASPTSNADVRYSMEAEDQDGDGYSELTDTINELRAELKKQTARAEHFKAETRLSQNRGQIDEASVEKFTRSILKAYESKADFNMTKAGVTEYANWMTKTFNELRTVDDEQRWADFEDEAYTRAVDLMRPVILNTETLLNEDAVQTGKDIRSYLKSGRGISISDADQRAIYTLGYDNFQDFRKRNFGNLKITKDGPRVDQVWSELQDQFGKDFFPDDIYNSLDQLERINEVLADLDPIYGNPFESNAYEAEDAIDYAARDVLHRVLTGEVREVAPTFSDKMHDRVEAAHKEAVRRVQDVRRETRAKTEEKINALKKHYAEINKNRSTLTQMSKERQRLLKIARRLTNRKMPAVNKTWVEETVGNLDLAATSITGRKIKNLMDLSDWYEEQKQSPDFIPMPQIEKQLQRLVKRQMGSARDALNAQKAGLGFYGMTQEEVLDLTETLLSFEHQLDTRDKLINNTDKRSVYAMTLDVLTDIEKSRGINVGRNNKLYMGVRNFVIDETLNPRSVFRRIAGYNENDPLYQRYVELNEGQHASMAYEMNALGEFDEWMNDKEFQRDHAGRHAKTVTGTFGGQRVTMTRDVLISLYMHSLNDDNMRHIARSGAEIPDAEQVRKGNMERAYENATRVRIQPSEMRAFLHGDGKLTDKEMSFVHAMQKYFSGSSKDLNRVSLDLYGFERANEENYFPIEVDKNFLRQDANALFKASESTGEITMDPGFLQSRVEASQTIICRGALDVLMSSIHKNANFIGFAIPIRNFSKIYSAKSVDFEELPSFRGRAFAAIDQASVRDLIEKKWGEQANKYIVKLINDLQGIRAEEGQFVKTLRALRSHYAGAVLTVNLSVALKQAASYPTAAAVIGWKPLLQAFGLNFYTKVDRVNLDLIKKYTPLLDYRRKGFTDTERGELAQRNIHMPAALNWIQGMDVLTTQKLWRACEYYVQDNFKALERRSDPYYRKVAEIYNRVIEETQPNYTTMQRPGNLRGDFITTSINMFKTQPFQNFNILYDAFGNYAAKRSALKTASNETVAQARADFKEARKNLANSVSAIGVSAVVFAAMSFAWGLLRRKKEPKDAGKEMAKNIGSAIAGVVPFGSDVYDLVSSWAFGEKYWGYETVTTSSINDFANAVNTIVTTAQEGKQIKVKDVFNLANYFAQLFGLPLSNAVNILNIGFAWAGLGSLQDFLQDGIAPADANYVWEQRRKAGVTTKQIAEACGVQESTVRGWQSGKIPNMKKESKEKLAGLLGISVNELNREIELSKE